MDYNHTRDSDISSIRTSTSHNIKVDAPVTKPDTTCAVPYAKGAAVLDSKGAADKTITAVTQDENIQ